MICKQCCLLLQLPGLGSALDIRCQCRRAKSCRLTEMGIPCVTSSDERDPGLNNHIFPPHEPWFVDFDSRSLAACYETLHQPIAADLARRYAAHFDFVCNLVYLILNIVSVSQISGGHLADICSYGLRGSFIAGGQ